MWFNVKYARCNSAGENEDFERTSKQYGMDFQFEHAIAGTPQQNGRVERKFPTPLNRKCAMLNGEIFWLLELTLPHFLRTAYLLYWEI